MTLSSELTLLAFVNRINLVLSSATIIFAFSLLAYLLVHNFRNTVARAFCVLLAFVCIVYGGDVFLDVVTGVRATQFWLHFQWLGIPFVPAAYLHFSDTLLRTTNSYSRWRSVSVILAYIGGGLTLALVLATPLIVGGVDLNPVNPLAAHFDAGPFFWLFTVLYFVIAGYGLANILRARYRCLTPTSRRRMGYVLVSIAAPLSVFPYLIMLAPVVNFPAHPLIFGALAAAANIATIAMVIVMTYGVAYQGVLISDRAVKRNLIKYIIQAPMLGSVVILAMLLVPPVERVLGLPRETIVIFAVVNVIVIYQLIVSVARPAVDRLVFWGDWGEVHWLRRLDERLFTSTDLRQLLENVLTSICDVLRVGAGLVAVTQAGRLVVDTYCGSEVDAETALNALDDAAVTAIVDGATVERGGYWFVPLRGVETPDNVRPLLGVLGIGRNPATLNEQERGALVRLIAEAERALEDRRLQQGIFGALRQIETEIETLQRARSQVRYVGSPLSDSDASLVDSPDFVTWVRDALSHYWGGPKLANSPLLRLRIVREALAHDNNPTHAVRSVLDEALARLKPETQRSLSAVEWTLYNILELKFIKGQRTRDIANRLAMSESDLYRKQRVAIEQIAQQIATMEAADNETKQANVS
ncbi:MAG: histidine kinase N-terminal 7TM domain-containing protein [Anaerolineae bacterium]